MKPKSYVPLAVLVGLVFAMSQCSSGDDRLVLCPKGTWPCGDGCMPQNAVCCDSGDQKTSSFCTNSASGGCSSNPSGGGTPCHKQNPFASEVAQFCCAANGDFGSNDCPAGEHHCGLSCQPKDKPCCASGASYEECPTASYPCEMGSNSCGICRTNGGNCHTCPAGYCCQGDPCGAAKCVANPICSGSNIGDKPNDGSGGGGCGGSGGSSGVQCGSATCGSSEICVSTRSCIKNVMSSGCECSDPAPDQCAATAALGVSACGTCSASYTACCPGTMCVNGHCQDSCP